MKGYLRFLFKFFKTNFEFNKLLPLWSFVNISHYYFKYWPSFSFWAKIYIINSILILLMLTNCVISEVLRLMTKVIFAWRIPVITEFKFSTQTAPSWNRLAAGELVTVNLRVSKESRCHRTEILLCVIVRITEFKCFD